MINIFFLQDQTRISADKVLNSVTENIMEMGSFYQKNPVTREQAEFLSQFLEQYELISWLKENMSGKQMWIWSEDCF